MTIQEITRIQAEALVLRKALEVLARDHARVHDYDPASPEGKLLATVITTGARYESTIKKIMDTYKERPE